jgi:hypothetical protein
MDKSKSPPRSPNEKIIRIKLLDIFPSIKELQQQQNDLDIIFQGLDIFYNLIELLKSKIELTINTKNKTSIIISLIKSNNIFATCVFNIKQGEQWVTFSYENKKKKEASFAQSLIDCIKLKLNCEISKNIIKKKKSKNINLNSKKINNNIKNINPKNISNYTTYTTEENNKIPNKMKIIPSSKGLKNISIEGSPQEKFQEKIKYSFIKYDNSNQNKINKEINTLNRSKIKVNFDRITCDDLSLRLNKIVAHNNTKEESKLNLTQMQKKKNRSNNNLNLLKNSNKNLKLNNKDNKIYNNFDSDSNKRNKQIIKNKILNTNTYDCELNILKKIKTNNKLKNKIERSQENIESIYLNNALTDEDNKRSKKELKNSDNINNKKNSKTPVITKINNFMNSHNSLKENKKKYSPPNLYYNKNEDDQSSSNFENENESETNNKNINNDSGNNILSNFDFNNNENNDYEKLREDFNLLYNDNYVKNVNEDLFKLEIELCVEKMTGLINSYNADINFKKLENRILEEKLKINANKFFKLKKLFYKLKLIRKKYKKDNIHINQNEMNIKLIDDKELQINKKEIELFNLLYPNQNDINDKANSNKKEELKKIITIILSKSINKNILSQENLIHKLDDIIKLDNNENNNEEKYQFKYTKPKTRTRIIPKLQQTKFTMRNNIDEPNDEIISFNKNLNEEDRKDNFNNNFKELNLNAKNLYIKNKFKTETYNPKKTYSKKLPK